MGSKGMVLWCSLSLFDAKCMSRLSSMSVLQFYTEWNVISELIVSISICHARRGSAYLGQAEASNQS